jgi:metal-responsive CopG/Arc/MetJ family transcriptional regulator
MARIARVSISLPADTLRAADRERRNTRESRSEFFRRAVDELIRRRRERGEVERYVAGYVAEPETPAQDWVDRLGRDLIEQEPWD